MSNCLVCHRSIPDGDTVCSRACMMRVQGRDKPREDADERRPPPPEELADALHDKVHLDTGRSRPGRARKVRR